MSTDRPSPPTLPPTPPVTEAELHAFVDGRLPAEREAEIAAYLAARPDDAQRVEAYRAQKRELHALFDPVLDEQPGWLSPSSAAPRAGGCAASDLEQPVTMQPAWRLCNRPQVV